MTQLLVNPSDTRVNAIAYALKQKWSVQKLHELTDIDPWFLHRLDGIVKTGERLEHANALNALRKSELKRAKQLGFSDAQIASHVGCGATEDDVRAVRIKQFGIVPVVKQIDTMAAEYPAATNYLYTMTT